MSKSTTQRIRKRLLDGFRVHMQDVNTAKWQELCSAEECEAGAVYMFGNTRDIKSVPPVTFEACSNTIRHEIVSAITDPEKLVVFWGYLYGRYGWYPLEQRFLMFDTAYKVINRRDTKMDIFKTDETAAALMHEVAVNLFSGSHIRSKRFDLAFTAIFNTVKDAPHASVIALASFLSGVAGELTKYEWNGASRDTILWVVSILMARADEKTVDDIENLGFRARYAALKKTLGLNMSGITAMPPTFGMLDPDQQRELKIAAWIDHKPLEMYVNGSWEKVVDTGVLVVFTTKFAYRIAAIPDSINWDHVAPEYVAMARDNQHTFLYKNVPTWSDSGYWSSGETINASLDAFASYIKGDVAPKDSLVLRPGIKP